MARARILRNLTPSDLVEMARDFRRKDGYRGQPYGIWGDAMIMLIREGAKVTSTHQDEFGSYPFVTEATYRGFTFISADQSRILDRDYPVTLRTS